MNLSIGKKMGLNTLLFSIVALIPLTILGVMAVRTAHESFIQNKFDQLVSIREIKKTRLIIALQLSLEAINNIMQKREGLGKTGETYIVGPDHLMRSDSFLDSTNHSVKASFANPSTGSVKTLAITEMDKVVQQNEANAEESASAAEEMSAQAEQLKEYVDELVVLVTGKKSETSHSKGFHGTHHPIKTLTSKAPKPIAVAKTKKTLLAHKTNEVRPDQVIPFDEDASFKDF